MAQLVSSVADRLRSPQCDWLNHQVVGSIPMWVTAGLFLHFLHQESLSPFLFYDGLCIVLYTMQRDNQLLSFPIIYVRRRYPNAIFCWLGEFRILSNVLYTN